jgi:spore protease
MNPYPLYQLMGVPLDLALEVHEILSGEGEIPGVSLEKTTFEHGVISTIRVLDEQGESAMGKPRGTYVTLESEALRTVDRTAQSSLISILSDTIKNMLDLPDTASVLCCGIGNPQVISDALGPMTANRLTATRSLFEVAPEMREGLREVSVIAPGVSGVTGIETAEILESLIGKIKPDCLICVDALAAGSLNRLSATIQLSDTGIFPGSGVGGRHKPIDRHTMGIPVLALGVPTVVNAGVIVHQAMEALTRHLEEVPSLSQAYSGLQPPNVKTIIDRVLEPFDGHLTVTPKDVDEQIHNLVHIISGAITTALHPGMDPEQLKWLP